MSEYCAQEKFDINQYAPTPFDHLPIGFPLASLEEREKYEPIWLRAFEIHAHSHDFSSRTHLEFLLNVMPGANYCDCYELAYQQLKHIL